MSETPEQPAEPEIGADNTQPEPIGERPDASLMRRAALFGPATAWAALWAAIIAYCCSVGTYVLLYHSVFYTQAFDLGIFDQALWLVSHGESPFVTVRGLHRFGDHVEFILYLLAPAYWVWEDVRCALLLQTAVIALGALPVFLLARKRLGHGVALCFAIAYLLNPSVQNLNLDHVHAEAFAATALLFAYYFASERRFTPMFIFCGAAMLCKEDVAITTGVFGLLVAWRWNRKAGFALLAASVVWFALCMKLFLPLFNGSGFFRTSAGWFAGWSAHKWDLEWYWRAFVHDPTAGRMHWPAITYLLQLLGPLAFLSLLSPATALVALPAIVINLLTTTDYMRSVNYHYMTSITPFLVAAAVEGAALIASGPRHPLMLPFLRTRKRGQLVLLSPGVRLIGPLLPAWSIRIGVAAVLLGAGVVGNMELSHLPLHQLQPKLRQVSERSRTDRTVLAIRSAIAMIPADAAVSADYQIVPHLTHRKDIYMFPNPFSAESWGIRDENTRDPNIVQYILVQDSMVNAAKRKTIANLLRQGQFREEFTGGGVCLYKRIAPAQEPVVVRPTSGRGLVGVFYSFDTPLSTIPDSRGREPEFQTLFPTVDFPPTTAELVSEQGMQTGMRRRFLATFEGFLMAPEAGEYEFTVYSDDGFRLSVAGRRVSECNQLHAFGATRGTVTLPVGLAPIKLLYFDNEPPHGLRLEWRRPGATASEVIPAESLYPTREAAEQK